MNPAFRNLTASDFKVIELGYNPGIAAPASLASVSIKPSSITAAQPAIGTVTLSGAAPAGGAVVSLASANLAAQCPVRSLYQQADGRPISP